MSIAVRNPRTGAMDYTLDPLDAAGIKSSCAALVTAQYRWSKTTMAHRVSVLMQFKESIEKNKAALTNALISDTGRRMVSGIEVNGIVSLIDRWCRQAPLLFENAQSGNTPTAIPGISYQSRLHALGLVAVISPWNFPLTLSMIDTIPALLAGCAVAVKPSEITPRFAAPLRACISAVPELAAVFTVFDGDGTTGQTLVNNAAAVCFTGSVATGRKVGEHAARNFIPSFLELGGKDAAIVLANADIELAATALLRGSVVNSGQACQSIERIYADQSIIDPFVEYLVHKAQQVQLNANDIHHGHLGPLIFAQQATIISAQLADAVAKGAVVHTGGDIQNINGGLYCAPTILTSVSHDMKIMTDETFGPILPVMPFSSMAEAVTLANDSIYGLSAAVFSKSVEDAEEIAEQLHVGAVSINDAALTSMVWEAEKSSFKLSGLGASRMGASGFLRFFRQQALICQSGAPVPMEAFDEKSML